MFLTKTLRSAAVTAIPNVTKSTRTVVRSGARIGENWAITESKRLVPTIAMYGTGIGIVLGWPFIVRKVDLDIGISGMKVEQL